MTSEPRVSGRAAEDVAAADDDGQLDPLAGDPGGLLGDPADLLGADAALAGPAEALAGELQQDAAEQRGPSSGVGRCPWEARAVAGGGRSRCRIGWPGGSPAAVEGRSPPRLAAIGARLPDRGGRSLGLADGEAGEVAELDALAGLLDDVADLLGGVLDEDLVEQDDLAVPGVELAVGDLLADVLGLVLGLGDEDPLLLGDGVGRRPRRGGRPAAGRRRPGAPGPWPGR